MSARLPLRCFADSPLVCATLGEAITPRRTLIFCSSFQVAWDELKAELKGPVELEGSSALADTLNKGDPSDRAFAGTPSRDDLDATSFVARAGVGPSFLAQVARELRTKFGEREDFLLPDHIAPGDVLAYAYLSKDLAFPAPFPRDNETGVTFGWPAAPARFACFGVWPGARERREQVHVHHFADANEFVLELSARTEGDRILVARIERPTLADAVREVIEHATKPRSFFARLGSGTKLNDDDVVKIPVVDFDRTRDFAELEGRRVLGHDNLTIAKAIQRVRFKLDEKGAILRSAGVIMAPRGGRSNGRLMVCDGPFLVLLLRAGRKAPYFALWVGAPDVLAPIG